MTKDEQYRIDCLYSDVLMGKMVYNWCIEFGLSDEKSKELALHSLDLDILEDFKKWSLGDKETFVNGIVSFINKREYNRINGNTK